MSGMQTADVRLLLGTLGHGLLGRNSLLHSLNIQLDLSIFSRPLHQFYKELLDLACCNSLKNHKIFHFIQSVMR
jgi:hypothetical protein